MPLFCLCLLLHSLWCCSAGSPGNPLWLLRPTPSPPGPMPSAGSSSCPSSCGSLSTGSTPSTRPRAIPSGNALRPWPRPKTPGDPWSCPTADTPGRRIIRTEPAWAVSFISTTRSSHRQDYPPSTSRPARQNRFSHTEQTWVTWKNNTDSKLSRRERVPLYFYLCNWNSGMGIGSLLTVQLYVMVRWSYYYTFCWIDGRWAQDGSSLGWSMSSCCRYSLSCCDREKPRAMIRQRGRNGEYKSWKILSKNGSNNWSSFHPWFNQ